jgi:hypothetical protein
MLRAFLLPMRFCVPIIAHCVNITMVWQGALRSSLSTQMRKEIRAHRLFACSAAGPALKEQQRLTRSIARSTRRSNQTRTAFGTRVAVPRHMTPRHCDNRDLRHSETCRTAYCARVCELLHTAARTPGLVSSFWAQNLRLYRRPEKKKWYCGSSKSFERIERCGSHQPSNQ